MLVIYLIDGVRFTTNATLEELRAAFPDCEITIAETVKGNEK